MGKLKAKEESLDYNAYAIVKGANPIQFRLIRLKMRGKVLNDVEIVLEEILPVVVARVEQLLKKDGLLE